MNSDKFRAIYEDSGRVENCSKCVCNRCRREEKTSFCKSHCDMCIVVDGNGKRETSFYNEVPY